jgi:hypothetical protein
LSNTTVYFFVALAPGSKLDILYSSMAQDELLTEIKKLFVEEREYTRKTFEAEREHTRKIVKEEVKEALAANNKVLGTIVRVEIAAAKEELVKKIERKLTDL